MKIVMPCSVDTTVRYGGKEITDREGNTICVTELERYMEPLLRILEYTPNPVVKVEVIKVVRLFFPNLGIKDAKYLVEDYLSANNIQITPSILEAL